MAPWLSVILPVHGGAAMLGATLASAAEEGCEGVEFLAYDSGQDGGAARAVAQAFSDRLCLTWTDTPHLKPWTAKTNLGVAQARAPHIAMLHQDDLWRPGHLDALRASLALAPDAALSVGPSRFVGQDGADVGPWRLPLGTGRHEGGVAARKLIVQNTIAIPSPLIRREAYLAVGGLDDALWYTADWDLYLKLALAGPVVVRAEATTAFRIHGGSLTMTGSRDAAAFRRQHDIVLERHGPALAPLPRGVAQRAQASVAVNCALAGLASGNRAALGPAVRALAGLGPWGVGRLLQETRLIDRLWPRARLALKGRL